MVSLRVDILWATTALGHAPVNVLGWVLDVTGLAVDAVDGIDLEPFLARIRGIVNVLVNAG